ncbi:hypothetical protein D3C75_715960 [compost metagenome]
MGDRATAGAKGFHLNHWHADTVTEEVAVFAEVGATAFAKSDVERGTTHYVVDTEWLGHAQAGLRGRCRTGVDRVDRPLTHYHARSQTSVGLEIAGRLLRAQLLEQRVDAFDITTHHWAKVGVDHGCRGACVFANLREHLVAAADKYVR